MGKNKNKLSNQVYNHSTQQPSGRKSQQKHEKQSTQTTTSTTTAQIPTTPRELLEYILHPISIETFFTQYWEKKPLFIERKNKDYYKGIFTKDDFFKYVKKNEGKQRNTIAHHILFVHKSIYCGTVTNAHSTCFCIVSLSKLHSTTEII